MMHPISTFSQELNRRKFIVGATAATASVALIPLVYDSPATAAWYDIFVRLAQFAAKIGMTLLGISPPQFIQSTPADIGQEIARQLAEILQRGYNQYSNKLLGLQASDGRPILTSPAFFPMQKPIQDDPRRFITPFLNPNPSVLTSDPSIYEQVVGGKLSTRTGHVLPDVTDYLEQNHGMAPTERHDHMYPKAPRGMALNGADPELYITRAGDVLSELLRQDDKNNEDIVWIRVKTRKKGTKTGALNDVIYTGSKPGREFPASYVAL